MSYRTIIIGTVNQNVLYLVSSLTVTKKRCWTGNDNDNDDDNDDDNILLVFIIHNVVVSH